MPFIQATGEYIIPPEGERKETSNKNDGVLTKRLKEGFFQKYLKGKSIIDVGSGNDPITDTAFKYDKIFNKDYDATFLLEVFDESYDVVYSSHFLEHSNCNYLAIRNWWRVLKPSGHMIISVPDRIHYERKTEMPSHFNRDHKYFILEDKEELPFTLNLKSFLAAALSDKDYQLESLGRWGYSIEAIIKKHGT